MKATPSSIPARPERRRQLLLAIGAGLLVPGGAARARVAGRDAPDFTLPTLTGPNLRLAEQKGRVVMLNFWASWCGPCRREMPELEKLYGRYRASGFQLLAISVDEDPANAAGASSRMGVHFPVLLDGQRKVSRQYELDTMPSTVIIDRDGRMRYRHQGYHEGAEELYERQIRELLKE